MATAEIKVKQESPKQRSVPKQEEILDPLFQLSQNFACHVELDELLQQILETALKLLKARRGTLMLIEPRSDSLKMKAFKGMSPQHARRLSLKMGEGVAGYVAKEGKPLLIEEGVTYKRFQKTPVSRLESKCFVSFPILSVPLNIFGKTLGVMTVSDTWMGNAFTTEDRSLLSILAAEVSIMIAYSQLTEKVGELENHHVSKIGQLASGMAYRIHNPLTVISGHAQYLLLHIPQECKSAEILKKIVEQSEKAAQMIKKLLHFSKLPLRTQSAKIDEVLDEIRRDSVG